MLAIVPITVGIFLIVYGILTFKGSFLREKGKTQLSYRILRLRQESTTWFTGPKWDSIQKWYRNSGLTISIGEVIFYLALSLIALELFLALLALVQHRAFLLVGVLVPFIVILCGWIYIQHKIERRKRILLADYIHCFSRLADFVYFKEVTDHEKLRRSMIGTRILHQALPSEVVYRLDPRGALREMEQWVAFDEERLLLRNALQEALYSIPEDAEKSLMETVYNLRYRKAALWKKELKKIEITALFGPVTNAIVFALVMIVSMLTIVRQMMGW